MPITGLRSRPKNGGESLARDPARSVDSYHPIISHMTDGFKFEHRRLKNPRTRVISCWRALLDQLLALRLALVLESGNQDTYPAAPLYQSESESMIRISCSLLSSSAACCQLMFQFCRPKRSSAQDERSTIRCTVFPRKMSSFQQTRSFQQIDCPWPLINRRRS